MTDAQTKLKETFLEPETRCDTYISATTKKHWKILLDMLEIVLDICKKNDLKVWLAAGSVLGAVRHKGIIPWDDDVDVMMPREDYKKFCKIVADSLPDGYFVQTQFVDPSMYDPFLKIMKRGTTAINKWFAESGCGFAMSVFLDVFPIDKIPEDQRRLTNILKNSYIVEKLRGYCYRNRRIESKRKCSFLRKIMHRTGSALFKILGPKRLTEYCNNLFERYNQQDGALWCLCPIWWRKSSGSSDCHRWSYPASVFEKTVYMPFEYLSAPIPAGYKQLLKITYGEWHKFERGTSCHSTLIVDTERDYKEVLKEKFGYIDSDFR